MSFDPQKFFIGLVDFFSIFMPGAMLAYLTKESVAQQFGLIGGFPINNTETGAVFLFASYLLGHLVFLLSAKLDDLIYNPLRDWTYWGQIKRLSHEEELSLSKHWQRKLATSGLLFNRNPDAAVMQAQVIKARALNKLEAENSINVFQWSKARLTKEFQEGLHEVNRFEANSKFFRSFVVVSGVLTLFYALQHDAVALVCFAGMIPALWRYIDQRFKATQQACWFVITLEAMGTTPQQPFIRKDGLTHAGGVVYRHEGGELQCLLVEASRNRLEFVLPKGHIEPGENPRQTAVREVREESGHWARVERWIEDAPLDQGQQRLMVRWFLMEFVEETRKWSEVRENRQYLWLSFDEAIRKATFPETHRLLEKAAKELNRA
ncbi:MAG: NUDIX domain-containing protein [Chlorobiaceae bacterium]|jgi:8-oxo-dGTP pyrophosphatase MutT (NUDIX family)|nr:NUDIX domain-containing protein [Chlorobiaceae bacterium]